MLGKDNKEHATEKLAQLALELVFRIGLSPHRSI
jgi:hypothetical protein